MTTTELRDRALACYPSDRARFGPLVLIILGAVLSAVITHYVEVMLDKCDKRTIRRPWFWQRRMLRERVREFWAAPEVQRKIREALEEHPEWHGEATGLNALTLDREHGADVTKALLDMAAGLSDQEISAALGRPA